MPNQFKMLMKPNEFEKNVLKKSNKKCLAGAEDGLSSTHTRRRVSCTIHPLLQGPQQISSTRVLPMRAASKSCLSEFTQRVMSGKLLQLKQYQNQLTETQTHLQVAKEENKALTRLLKRHEVSLRRYEGENAGMPRLLRSHAEEVRTLRTTVHQLKSELREVQGQLREKDAEVVTLKDTLAKLRLLAENNKVFDQEQSQKKIEELQGLADEQNREIQLLSRRILLETKKNQRILNSEVSKHKETKKSLDEALITIDRLEKQKRTLIIGQTMSYNMCKSPAISEDIGGGEPKIRKNSHRKNLLPVTATKTPDESNLNTNIQSKPNFRPKKRTNTPTI